MKKKMVAILMSLSAFMMLIGSACGAGFTTASFLPGLSFANLTVSPNPAEIGQTVAVTVDITNDGESGTYPAPLMVDGVAAGVEMVELEAGASETVTYNYVATFGGSYEIVLGDQTETLVITPSTVQNILKMVPASWDAFLYFGAKTMRSDNATAPDGDLGDLWDIADSYLEFFADIIELETAAYPTGDLPFTLAQLDYMAFSIGGLATTEFDEEGELPNMTLMLGLGSTATETQISSFLNNFQDDWFSTDPPEGGSFVSGTYDGVSTWTPTPAVAEPDFPDLLLAYIDGGTLLFGPTADVQACITVINTEGDADSMFENDNIRGIMGDFGNPVLMAVIDGEIPLPEDEEGGDGPTLPDSVAITAGIAMEKTGDTMRLQAILEIGEMGDWLALLTDAIPTPTEFQAQQEAREEERARENEYWNIQNAVYWLMGDNWLPDGELPHPVTTTATQDMNAFPDATSVAGSTDKEWSNDGTAYTGSDGPGYLLWQHDGNANGNATGEFDYIDSQYSAPEYFYTCEADGTLHQWSDAAKTTEYEYERDWEEPET